MGTAALQKKQGMLAADEKEDYWDDVSSFFSLLPINKSYFVWFLNYNLIFLAILIEFSEGSHPIVDI